MDGWLKVLIATTCVVVIAGGGLYARNEIVRSRDIAAREVCTSRASDVVAGISRDDDVTELKRCIFAGYLNPDNLAGH